VGLKRSAQSHAIDRSLRRGQPAKSAAASFARFKAGSSITGKIATIAIRTRSSIKVNAVVAFAPHFPQRDLDRLPASWRLS
jgi:hypothetical protein